MSETAATSAAPSTAGPPDLVELTIDGTAVQVTEGRSVLDAARSIGLDIPALCYLEKCGPLNSCQACLVKIDGRLVPSCGTAARPGMKVESETAEVHEARRTALELLFSDHVGDCLSPCNRLCPLGLNIPVMLRHVEKARLQEASATMRGVLPLAGVLGRLCHHPCEQGCRRGTWDEAAQIRTLERHVADWDTGLAAGSNPDPAHLAALLACKPPTGKSVVIVGAGPAGLTAAWQLAKQGHRVTVADRREALGGTLRDVPETDLPRAALEAELALLLKLGIELKSRVVLGQDVTLEGLSRGFDAILVAVGALAAGDESALDPIARQGVVVTDPNTCGTALPKVFATGSAVKPVKQLVRAMAEGRAAAECVHRFLSGVPPRRPEKQVSSVMGRLTIGELRTFLAGSNAVGVVSPCDRCAGFSRQEATTEASRCLHCECQSSGNCVLQHYAQTYSVDANRFRSGRKTYERQLQPGGVVFEQGKCILCGICVKLTEMAAEPLGLAFIGRGFDVRVAAPFNQNINDGLQKVAAECVKHCPTGALSFEPK